MDHPLEGSYKNSVTRWMYVYRIVGVYIRTKAGITKKIMWRRRIKWTIHGRTRGVLPLTPVKGWVGLCFPTPISHDKIKPNSHCVPWPGMLDANSHCVPWIRIGFHNPTPIQSIMTSLLVFQMNWCAQLLLSVLITKERPNNDTTLFQGQTITLGGDTCRVTE
jgi:hypothetical protein